MDVWRVENSQGYGPYHMRHALSHETYCLLETSLDKPLWHHDAPECEINLGDWGDWYFGFESHNSLLEWFGDKLLQCLAAEGFTVKQFKIPECDVVRATHQVVFKK